MMDAPIVVEKVSHWFGEGALRKQVLFNVDAVVRAGEVVILTGPSGSEKTTLLTLIGALRSTQEGSLRVLGHELRGADERTLTEVRKSTGDIFQAHNLLEALTVRQNVEMTLQLHEEFSVTERKRQEPPGCWQAWAWGSTSSAIQAGSPAASASASPARAHWSGTSARASSCATWPR